MTCNPSWPEIEEHLLVIAEVQNQPDLVSRVFRAKVEEMKTDILKRNIFGRVAAFMYTIEFQKCGLPHAHFLIILNNKYKLLTPEAYDKIICAELPDRDTNDYLYTLVTKHMMHGPCGNLNPKCPYIEKKGYCKFEYPKEFADHTSKGKDGYPIYQRRNTGKVVTTRGQLLDNSWVVPYNPYLLSKFIYHNEIKQYQSARWVSPPEATWRLFGVPISEIIPTVYHLQITPNLNKKQIRHMTLNNINDILHSMGHDISEFILVPERISASSAAKEAQDSYFERNIILREEDLLLEAKLNNEQREAYNIILDRIFKNKPGAFFIDGPGGTGKTFLYRAIPTAIR
uniref:ATP-dependent DNA helicase n=1 Tax=Nicotiana tabacum TaxID=4097 RepID=A0A1S3XEN0_TOBAC|nr:PREDICTED: uncharacterized protein LOC107764197 [Nicotiana tabacum]